MASDGTPGTLTGVISVVGTQASGGNRLPQNGKGATATAATAGTGSIGAAASSDAKSTVAPRSDPQSLVNQINKHFNDSGLPDQFRVDPASGKYIQQINPSTGEVVGQYLASEFPALARGVGMSGLLIDYTA